jgi:antitoxin (DNA-binding transcriptional repressor) of toxin-antitoxin stability system
VKTIEISAARRSLAEVAADRGDEILVVVDRKRPVAAIVPLENIDPESIALSTHPDFLRIVARSRAALAAGRTLTVTEMREKVMPSRVRRSSKPTSRAGDRTF